MVFRAILILLGFLCSIMTIFHDNSLLMLFIGYVLYSIVFFMNSSAIHNITKVKKSRSSLIVQVIIAILILAFNILCAYHDDFSSMLLFARSLLGGAVAAITTIDSYELNKEMK